MVDVGKTVDSLIARPLTESITAVLNTGGGSNLFSSLELNPLLTQKTCRDLDEYKFSLAVYDDTVVTNPIITTFVFRNTPDEYTDIQPVRYSITQTPGGYWLEDFGPGVREINIKGVTGFRKMANSDGVIQDGKTIMESLNNIINTAYLNRRRDLYNNKKDFRKVTMSFTVHGEDAKFYDLIVHPINFSISRSKSNPLLYYYDIRLIVIGINSPKSPTAKDMLNSDDGLGSLNQTYKLLQKVTEQTKDIVEKGIDNCPIAKDLIKMGDGIARSVNGLLTPITGPVGDFILSIKNNEIAKVGGDIITYLAPKIIPTMELLDSAQAALYKKDYEGYYLSLLGAAKIYQDTTDANNAISRAVSLGEISYDIARTLRQYVICLSALEKHAAKHYGDTAERYLGRRNNFEDSGCASTLR
jgi:hypothetical protein